MSYIVFEEKRGVSNDLMVLVFVFNCYLEMFVRNVLRGFFRRSCSCYYKVENFF